MRHTIVLLSLVVVGCKEKTCPPDVSDKLDVCNKTIEAKNQHIKALEDEAARQMRGTGSASEITIAIEGDLMTVKPGKPGDAPRPIDDKAAAAAATEFQDVVRKSRGAIQKCYEQALKKNSGLQSSTITLTVSASFTNAGAYQNANFNASKDLGNDFDTCMKTIASKWQLSQKSPSMNFKAQVSLTPS
jgi:hypothetical protein